MDKHYHLTVTKKDDTTYYVCGFWRDEDKAKRAILKSDSSVKSITVDDSRRCDA